MKNEKLLQAIGKIDDELVYGAVNDTKAKKKKNTRVKWVALAACIPLIFGITAYAIETTQYNAAVGYLTSLGILAEDLSDYSRKEVKEAAKIIVAEEPRAEDESNAIVDEYYKLAAENEESADTPAKVTSDQIKELTPTMTREEVLAFLGDTQDVGSGIFIYIYEVDGQYLLRIPFAGDDVQLGVNGEDLLKALEPIEK